MASPTSMSQDAQHFRAQSLTVLFVALCISVGLLGGLTVQGIIYYKNYRDDKMSQKHVVAAIWILTVLMVSFSATSAHGATISGFGNVASAGGVKLSVAAKGADTCGYLVISLIHILHLRRIWILYQQEKVIPVIVSVIVGITLSVGIAVGGQLLAVDLLADMGKAAVWTLGAYFGSTALTDIAITAALCYYLERSKSSIMSSSTQSTIMKLMGWILWSGASSFAWSLAALITFFTSPGTLFVLLPLSWSTLYANSFLQMTLSRTRVRQRSVARTSPLETGNVIALEFSRSVQYGSHHEADGECGMVLEDGKVSRNLGDN